MKKCKELVAAKQKSSVSKMIIELLFASCICKRACARVCTHTHTHTHTHTNTYTAIANLYIGQALVTPVKDVFKTSRSKGVCIYQSTDIADKNPDG